jgi:hypothetical protein
LFTPAGETVRIPYESTTLPGYFLTPSAGGAPRPTLIITDGYDGSVEELTSMAAWRRSSASSTGWTMYCAGMARRPAERC